MRPVDTGGRIRLDLVVKGLAAEGPVDVFAFDWQGAEIPNGGVARYARGRRPMAQVKGVRGRARWIVTGRDPLELTNLDAGQVRAAFAQFVHDQSYDFAWFSLPVTFAAHGDQVDVAKVLDCHDLEHYKHAGRAESTGLPASGAVRGLGARLSNRANIARWQSYYARAHDAVDRLVVCSAVDEARLDLPRVTIIPNGFRRPAQPAGAVPRSPGGGATLLFPGTMTYAPNADAAAFLVREVLPELLRRRSDVRLRLVGAADERVESLHSPPHVEVTGRVDDMEVELARADVVVVPIRFGSGTRLKILEGFAHRLPVVSTTIGAEGLGAAHEEALLLADSPAAIADACVRLLDDAELRRRLVDAAETFFLQNYEAAAVESSVGRLAREVTAQRASLG